ncbi:hypothetical protein DPZ17_00120 [Klebsiella pneumoniae]|nr:hypothetical protein DPZ17_00120 [Klebsiella pneumoniae]
MLEDELHLPVRGGALADEGDYGVWDGDFGEAVEDLREVLASYEGSRDGTHLDNVLCLQANRDGGVQRVRGKLILVHEGRSVP